MIKKMINLTIFFLFLYQLFWFPIYCDIISNDNNIDSNQNKVLMIAFSGLRWDVMKKYNMTTFERLKQHGILGIRKIEPFQTESLPSFVSIVTGQYPEKHGMISNKMINLKSKGKFDVKNKDYKWWSNVDPIWITNQKSGNISALCYWPGFNVVYDGMKVNYSCVNDRENSSPYADSFKELTLYGELEGKPMPYDKRVDQIKHWLSLPKSKQPSFIGVYFEDPLLTLMKSGEENEETKKVFQKIDNVTKDIFDFMKANATDYNLIILGESGATIISKHKFLQDYISKELYSTYDIIDDGPIMSINPTNKTIEDLLFHQLKIKLECGRVFKGRDLPKRFHYFYPGRTTSLIVVANENCRIFPDRTSVDKKKFMVGFDGQYNSTHSIFLGFGPKFKHGDEIESLENVDVYQILCRLLNLKPKSQSKKSDMIDSIFSEEEEWYIKIIHKVKENRINFTAAIISVLVVMFFVFLVMYVTVYRLCKLCKGNQETIKLKVSPNKNISNKRKRNDNGKEYLLSRNNFSSSQSESDDDLEETAK